MSAWSQWRAKRSGMSEKRATLDEGKSTPSRGHNVLNPHELYELEPNTEPRPGILIGAMGSFIDAGNVQQLLTQHLLETCNPEIVATFDTDQLVDYRGRRPAMVFDEDRFLGYDAPEITLYRLTDRDGNTFYLLAGIEPDFQWERLAEAVREVMDKLGVTLMVNSYGIPIGVPHTRPIGMTTHATSKELAAGAKSPFGRVQVPSGFTQFLELRLGEAGRPALGWAIHVPHYLMATDYHEGALAALNLIAKATDLDFTNDALVAAAAESSAAINAQIADNEEVQAVVTALERQYDAILGSADSSSGLLATDSSHLPTADELGADFEEFLKNVNGDDPNPTL